MGMYIHHVIIVTSWDHTLLDLAALEARKIGLSTHGPVDAPINGYRSIFISPDGSKEGWRESEQGDERRAMFRGWLRDQKYDDGSSSLEWFEACYGNDLERATISDHAWWDASVDDEVDESEDDDEDYDEHT